MQLAVENYYFESFIAVGAPAHSIQIGQVTTVTTDALFRMRTPHALYWAFSLSKRAIRRFGLLSPSQWVLFECT